MRRTHFYCSICGGPLKNENLRGRTSVILRNENAVLGSKDDTCDCNGAAQVPRGHTCQVHESVHSWRCNILNGYDAFVLSEDQIQWLRHGRMICAETATLNSEPGDECHDPGYFVTREGEFDYDRGLTTRDIPDKVGFPVHESCWNILNTVQKYVISDLRKIDLRELFCDLTRSTYIYTTNPCFIGSSETDPWFCAAYSDAAQFQYDAEWDPVKAYEWLVADPSVIDFELFVSECFGIEHNGINGLIMTSLVSSANSDPLGVLPTEICCTILELLPSKDVFRLAVASPTVKSIATHMPRGFWKSRLQSEMPWLLPVWPELNRALDNATQPVQYKKLLRHLKQQSIEWQKPERLYDDYFNQGKRIGLQNLRRVWECCESILERVEANCVVARVERNRVSPELRSRTFQEVVTIRESEVRYWWQSEVFFVPKIDQSPEVCYVTAYFQPDSVAIAGIEFSLCGESSGRLLGSRSPSLQSAPFPSRTKTRGFVLCLGPASDAFNSNHRDVICGLGILTDDSPSEPRIKLGSWTGNDVVQVFRIEGLDSIHQRLKNHSVVGISGHFDIYGMAGFGIIVADLSEGATNSRANVTPPPFGNSEMYYRWLVHYPSRPGQFVEKTHFPPLRRPATVALSYLRGNLDSVCRPEPKEHH
ncbi:hypothetical protein P170DRAFT_182744 [Aspergillus steynii IBT 23096]|uniref:F-box domain-containing protein n=1 Tax=Aspergillus steynii IBT 23096 TaxID=1392250 RepID=A0A2I2G902_9EURO|nr:uncharacterized protein P170DRAFT_182744 [Aspergillus steynii IBT 23096]PLB49366.1 hypothetical protein P170DRAFT_182744 [Aspergillus steynii IBT 23096]